jgi:hypothetical protein
MNVYSQSTQGSVRRKIDVFLTPTHYMLSPDGVIIEGVWIGNPVY